MTPKQQKKLAKDCVKLMDTITSGQIKNIESSEPMFLGLIKHACKAVSR